MSTSRAFTHTVELDLYLDNRSKYLRDHQSPDLARSDSSIITELLGYASGTSRETVKVETIGSSYRVRDKKTKNINDKWIGDTLKWR